MNLDSILWLSGSVIEAAVVGLLVYRRIWRTLPAFFIYNIWTLIGSLGAYAIYHNYASHYLTAYIVEMVVDSVLLFAVLVELAWSALSPVRASLPRILLVVIALLILVLGAMIWPFASVPITAHTPHEMIFLWHLQQTFSILRIVIFLALASGSQLLSIGWRDRELQAATGLGFYSFVSVTVAVLYTHQTNRVQHNHLDRYVVASYLVSLVYWIVSFAQKEQERREFSPQMQHMLLTVADAARSLRIASSNSEAAKVQQGKRS